MEVTACDACGSLLTIMMRAGRPWGRVRVFWGKSRGGGEGRMVGVRERKRRYRGRQCEREPESKEGLVPHPSQPTCWVPTFRVLRLPGQSSSDSLPPLFFLSPFPDSLPRPPWSVGAIVRRHPVVVVHNFSSALRRLPIPPLCCVGATTLPVVPPSK